jgi:hypothetical protein
MHPCPVETCKQSMCYKCKYDGKEHEHTGTIVATTPRSRLALTQKVKKWKVGMLCIALNSTGIPKDCVVVMPEIAGSMVRFLSGHHMWVDTLGIFDAAGGAGPRCSDPYEGMMTNLAGLDTRHKDLIWWALQVRMNCGAGVTHHECHVGRAGNYDLFFELSPYTVNALLKALGKQARREAFIDIGAGCGLPLIVAAIAGEFKVCWGCEHKHELVDGFETWRRALIGHNREIWEPILQKITLEYNPPAAKGTQHGAFPQSLQEHLVNASVVLCWNERFSQGDNNTMYKLVSDHMLQNDAVFVGVELAGIETNLVEVEVALELDEQASYSMNMAPGRMGHNATFRFFMQESTLGAKTDLQRRRRDAQCKLHGSYGGMC